jgi:gas vesicle protein
VTAADSVRRVVGAGWVDDLVELGVPAIIGSIVGAVVGALISHYAAKSRGEEDHRRTLDVLVKQDQRRAAQLALESVRDIGNRARRSPDFGQLYNEWVEKVQAPAAVVPDPELRRRIVAASYVIFTAVNQDQAYVTYAVVAGTQDVEDWLVSWLNGEDPLPPRLPELEEMRRLVNIRSGRRAMEELNERIAERDR